MGDGLQLLESEKAAGALYGMDGSKDRGESLLVHGIGLQSHKVAIKSVEILVALYQELVDLLWQLPL